MKRAASTTWATLSINSNGSFIKHHPTDRKRTLHNQKYLNDFRSFYTIIPILVESRSTEISHSTSSLDQNVHDKSHIDNVNVVSIHCEYTL